MILTVNDDEINKVDSDLIHCFQVVVEAEVVRAVVTEVAAMVVVVATTREVTVVDTGEEIIAMVMYYSHYPVLPERSMPDSCSVDSFDVNGKAKIVTTCLRIRLIIWLLDMSNVSVVSPVYSCKLWN